MKTTLNKIREHSPRVSDWKKLLKHLGKTHADDEPLSILTILNSNGLDDALWCLRAVDGYEKEMLLYAVWCTRQVQHLMKDPRSIAVIDVAERHAHGQATDRELTAAADAAWEAWAVAGAVAGAVECSAARAVARDAAGEAAWDAAWTTLRAAAGAAGWGAAGAAAGAAAREAQEVELRRVLSEVEAYGITEGGAA